MRSIEITSSRMLTSFLERLFGNRRNYFYRLGWRGHGRLAGGYFEAHRLAIGKSRLGRASGGFVSPGKEKKPILMKEERRTTFTRPRGFFVSECIRALCVSPRERRSLSRFNCKFLLPDLLANCSTEPVKPLPLRAPVINTEFLTKIIYSLKIIFIFFSFFFLSYITVFFLFDSGIMIWIVHRMKKRLC